MGTKIMCDGQVEQETSVQRVARPQHMQLCRTEGNAVDQAFGQGTLAVLEAWGDLGDAHITFGEVCVSVVDIGELSRLIESEPT